MYSTPNISTMGLSAAALPLAATSALLRLALGLVLLAVFFFLSRRSAGVRSRDCFGSAGNDTTSTTSPFRLRPPTELALPGARAEEEPLFSTLDSDRYEVSHNDNNR